MRKRLAIFLIILVPGLTLAQTERTRKSPSLVFNHVTVIDMTGAPPKPDMTVVVVGNRITAIGKTGKIRVPLEYLNSRRFNFSQHRAACWIKSCSRMEHPQIQVARSIFMEIVRPSLSDS